MKAPVLFRENGDDEIRLGGLLCDTGHERCGFYAALLTELRYGKRKEGAIGLRLFLGDYLDGGGMQSEIAPEFVESSPRRGGVGRIQARSGLGCAAMLQITQRFRYWRRGMVNCSSAMEWAADGVGCREK